jgi:hypothetical protein
MPITRAQYLSGDGNQGDVLAGEVQAVKAGYGIIIDFDGTISIDLSTLVPTRLRNLDITPPFDGVSQVYNLVDLETLEPVAPNPSNNIIVFLAGVPQEPLGAYSVDNDEITFTEPPEIGTTFFAVTTAWP